MKLLSGCEGYYQSCYQKSGEILAESLSEENIKLQNSSFNFIKDYHNWIDILSKRPESMLFFQAVREYEFALISLALGQYRHSFMGLRLFLELSLAGVLFSSSEIELRTWLAGKRDILWSEIIDENRGIFSMKFTGAFFEELFSESPNYRIIAGKIYRECSEYVHGNAEAFNRLPTELTFDQKTFEDWHQKAENIRLIIVFAFSCRYLRFISDTELRMIEHAVLSNLAHISNIRAQFGGSVGG